MMAIFGTTSEIIFDINLLVQIVLIAHLAWGFTNKRLLRKHGAIMAVGTFSNLVTVLSIMVPSLLINWDAVVAAPLSPGVLITLIHAGLGTIAIFGGALFSIRYALAVKRVGPLTCGTRPFMRTTIILWLVSFVFGLGFYFYYYVG
ncbi:MAG: hypothetical protein ACW99U_04595 [Candidatus Thorarchaeota archaeon]|jgi:hypothetical protein